MQSNWVRSVFKFKWYEISNWWRYIGDIFFSFVPSHRSVSRLCVCMCLIEFSQPTKNKHIEGTSLKRSTNENE